MYVFNCMAATIAVLSGNVDNFVAAGHRGPSDSALHCSWIPENYPTPPTGPDQTWIRELEKRPGAGVKQGLSKKQ